MWAGVQLGSVFSPGDIVEVRRVRPAACERRDPYYVALELNMRGESFGGPHATGTQQVDVLGRYVVTREAAGHDRVCVRRLRDSE